MKTYKVEYLEDSHECEDCGKSWATGFIITCPNGEVIEKIPYAYCFDSIHYEEEEASLIILEREGIKIETI